MRHGYRWAGVADSESSQECTRVLVGYLATRLGTDPDQVPLDAPMVSSLGLDSVDMYEIRTLAERCLGRNVSDSEWERVRTVQDLLGLVDVSR